MSKNYLNQILDDEKQNTYLFVFFVFALIFGLTLFPAVMAFFGYIFVTLSLPAYGFQSFFTLTLCSCATYPLTVIFGLGAAWYCFLKKRYILLVIILLIPLCNLLVAVVANIAGY